MSKKPQAPSYQSTDALQFNPNPPLFPAYSHGTTPNIHPPSYDHSYGIGRPSNPDTSSCHEHRIDPESQTLLDGKVVAEMSPEIRFSFIRKVYSILTVMLLSTTAVSLALMFSPSAKSWVQINSSLAIISSIAALLVYFVLYWKRKSYPLNYGLLSLFTLLQAFALGTIVSFFNSTVVLQAFLITTGVFFGLTLFTMQSKYDFSGLAPYLFAALLALCLAGLINIFIPFNHVLNIVISVAGVLVFSGLVLLDTWLIMTEYSPEDFIVAVVGLYLDFINLFLYILRLVYECNQD